METRHPTLAAWLQPHRSQAIADAVGASRQQAHAWRTSAALPDVRFLPKLAEFLGADLAELTQLVACEAQRRALVA